MKKITSYITVNNKKYKYTLEKRKQDTVFVECDGANISQEFLAEDVPNLLIDLPNLIIAEKKYSKKQSEVVRFRVSAEDKYRIEKRATKEGYGSISGYMRHVVLHR